jgi:hypothetical protein
VICVVSVYQGCVYGSVPLGSRGLTDSELCVHFGPAATDNHAVLIFPLFLFFAPRFYLFSSSSYYFDMHGVC